MKVTSPRSVIHDVLLGGLDDYVDAASVYASTEIAGVSDPPNRRSLAIGVIAEMITGGLVVPGDLDRDGHHPWKCSSGDAIARIVGDWTDRWPADLPTPGAIVWLANTPAGDAIARAVLSEEGLA